MTKLYTIFLILVTAILTSQYFMYRENELLIEHRDVLINYEQIVDDYEQEIASLRRRLIKVQKDNFELMKIDTVGLGK